MNRDALGPALVAFLAIVALGIGASALDTVSSGGNTGIGEGSTFSLGQPATVDASAELILPNIIFQLLIVTFLIAFLFGLYQWRDDPRGLAKIVAGMTIAFAVIAAIILYANLGLSSNDKANVSDAGGLAESSFSVPGGGSGSASTEALSVTSDPLLLVLAVAAALVIGIVVFFRSQDDDSTPKPDSETEDSATMTELGRVAGRAADRIADDTDADTENEVYRAWQEMTDRLEVPNPQSQTPGEFAHAATDAGMEKADVTELTDLFRTVRYGGSDPTDERETRAVSALRRIEDEYGGES